MSGAPWGELMFRPFLFVAGFFLVLGLGIGWLLS